MTPLQLEDAARALRDAGRTRAYLPPLRETYPGISIDSAYEIQKLNAKLRLAEGRRLVGRKIGLTAVSVQRQLGVSQPDFGVLFDDMGYGDAEPIPASRTEPAEDRSRDCICAGS